MTVVKPFKGLRPAKELTEQIAALPYDVYNRKEAREIVEKNPLSFLQIDRGETLLDENVDIYSEEVYQACIDRLNEMIAEDQFVEDGKKAYYIYELERLGQIQRGLVGLVQAKDYEVGVIKKHENTREVKENDRIRHIDALKAHTGPIFLTYKDEEAIAKLFGEVVASSHVLFEFTSEDGVRHKGYCVCESDDIAKIDSMTERFGTLYIADGHHRAASAAKIAKKYNYEGECADFLAVIFPDSELKILDYNRVVKDLNGLSLDEFMKVIGEDFEIQKMDEAVSPADKASFGMYVEDQWYLLTFKKYDEVKDEPVDRLDVAILQDYLLKPVLGIDDPRLSNRIDFVGGIRGLGELEKRVATDMKIAFSMKPTSIQELMDVSDADLLMPPKSTWFEPKLRSGLFIHRI